MRQMQSAYGRMSKYQMAERTATELEMFARILHGNRSTDSGNRNSATILGSLLPIGDCG